MTKSLCAALVAACVLIAAPVQADWWKDESGQGRGGPPAWAERGGEPPDWARGRGVWDGHLKHGRGGPPPWADRGGEPPEWARGRGVWDGHYKPGRGGPPPWAGRGRGRAERPSSYPWPGPHENYFPPYPPHAAHYDLPPFHDAPPVIPRW